MNTDNKLELHIMVEYTSETYKMFFKNFSLFIYGYSFNIFVLKLFDINRLKFNFKFWLNHERNISQGKQSSMLKGL